MLKKYYKKVPEQKIPHKIWSNVRVKDHAKEVLEELKKI